PAKATTPRHGLGRCGMFTDVTRRLFESFMKSSSRRSSIAMAVLQLAPQPAQSPVQSRLRGSFRDVELARALGDRNALPVVEYEKRAVAPTQSSDRGSQVHFLRARAERRGDLDR